ncbi:MAG: VirB3 family type IV secretion system protein [Acidobacteriaceae bacterium]
MAAGSSRQNKVHKAMNRPLTILGAERRLFFVALIAGGAVFSLMHSLLPKGEPPALPGWQ